jgi:RHS repeat-associated protein
MSWTHLDRLGSPVALTDETGVIREKLEYDVWGKRRSTDDNNATPDSLDGKTDNRGFTGHEMLDQLDLVHMNGRVYNPLIGRFLSADPLVNDPINGQSYNRYAYVLNNPTNLTDLTGFCETPTGTAICGSVHPFLSCEGNCVVSAGGKDGENGAGGKDRKKGYGKAADRLQVKTNSANSGQGDANERAHRIEFMRMGGGGEGAATSEAAYQDYALGRGYITKEQWQDNATARGLPAAPVAIAVVVVTGVAGGAAVAEAPAIGGGIVAGLKRLFGLGKSEVQFGNVENQVNHTFRHIDKAGLDRTAVQQTIRQDVSRAAESLSKGQQYTGNVVVNGTRIEYSAFKLENGTINVGRITPPRP